MNQRPSKPGLPKALHEQYAELQKQYADLQNLREQIFAIEQGFDAEPLSDTLGPTLSRSRDQLIAPIENVEGWSPSERDLPIRYTAGSPRGTAGQRTNTGSKESRPTRDAYQHVFSNELKTPE